MYCACKKYSHEDWRGKKNKHKMKKLVCSIAKNVQEQHHPIWCAIFRRSCAFMSGAYWQVEDLGA